MLGWNGFVFKTEVIVDQIKSIAAASLRWDESLSAQFLYHHIIRTDQTSLALSVKLQLYLNRLNVSKTKLKKEDPGCFQLD